MTLLGFRRAVIFVAGTLITLTIAACDGSSGSSQRPTATPNQETTDTSTSENNDNNNSNTGNNSKPTDGSQTPTPTEIISESRALSIMSASCLAANCHATAEQLLNMRTTLGRIEDRSMPPTNQSRYTLQDDRRQSLVAFFIDRADQE